MDTALITNVHYTDETRGRLRATINGVETFVPCRTANRHYAEIMRQVEAGELTIQDAV